MTDLTRYTIATRDSRGILVWSTVVYADSPNEALWIGRERFGGTAEVIGHPGIEPKAFRQSRAAYAARRQREAA